jgi:hypothetical protein
VRILLELSANPNIADNNGTTPLIELLYPSGAVPIGATTKAFPNDLLSLFITNKASLNVCDKAGTINAPCLELIHCMYVILDVCMMYNAYRTHTIIRSNYSD